jgi:hypothetical protein
MSEVNPNKEIFFFRNTVSPFIYVFMSELINKNDFKKMFEFSEEISEETADFLVLEQNYKVVYVGDKPIIEEYFSHEDKPV